jgi:5-methylcytosine-specific restriction protein B
MAELSGLFPDTEWGIEADFNYYTPANIDNLWTNELRRGVKNKLEAAGLGETAYGTWLGDVHFLNIGIYRKSLFERYRSNAGWRIVLMSLPKVDAILVGLASHYQNAQNHNKLGEVSNLLYDIANDALQGEGHGSMYGRKVSSVDWDQNGLIPTPISTVAGVSIAPEVVFLKDVRTTTLKKILASFIAVKVSPGSVSQATLHQELTDLAATARHLCAKVYPFGGLEEFEAFRALALQDLAAAGTRLLLRKKSSTRSIVRVYYGPPGTGKTLSAVREAVKIVEPTFDDKGNPTTSFERFNDYHEQCAFITFHPSLQYEDLVESIRPVITTDDDDDGDGPPSVSEPMQHGQLRYRVHEGLLLRMIRRALQTPSKEFVVVVDEINRGDVSRILGPLISTLDSDKRVGAEFPIGIELQYPRAEELESRLFMPSNLHLIGTMNSSDRNIALVDHALRRRFDFIQIPPQPTLLRSTDDSPSLDCAELLRTINARIEHILDADHCIGHGYFVGCDKNSKVIERLATKIIPLLREYFYGNEGLMLLVLGDSAGLANNFFKVIPPEKHFERVFGLDQDAAAAFGYRPHNAPKSLEMDARFWNPSRLVPGPDDEAYAVGCLLKLCQATPSSDSTPGAVGGGPNEAPAAV